MHTCTCTHTYLFTEFMLELMRWISSLILISTTSLMWVCNAYEPRTTGQQIPPCEVISDFHLYHEIRHVYLCRHVCTCIRFLYMQRYRIVKAGSHPVAITQVVEHWQLKSEAPGSILSGCWFFTVLKKTIPKLFIMPSWHSPHQYELQPMLAEGCAKKSCAWAVAPTHYYIYKFVMLMYAAHTCTVHVYTDLMLW